MTGPERDRQAEADGPDAVAGPVAERPRVDAAAFAVVVFVGSVIPIPTAPAGGSGGGAGRRIGGGAGMDIVGALPVEVGLTGPFHLLGYAVFAALIVRAAGRERRVGAVAVAAIAATAFGLGIELVQAPIPWRSFAWSDAAVNAVGATVGAGGYAMTTRLYALGRFLR